MQQLQWKLGVCTNVKRSKYQRFMKHLQTRLLTLTIPQQISNKIVCADYQHLAMFFNCGEIFQCTGYYGQESSRSRYSATIIHGLLSGQFEYKPYSMYEQELFDRITSKYSGREARLMKRSVMIANKSILMFNIIIMLNCCGFSQWDRTAQIIEELIDKCGLTTANAKYTQRYMFDLWKSTLLAGYFDEETKYVIMTEYEPRNEIEPMFYFSFFQIGNIFKSWWMLHDFRDKRTLEHEYYCVLFGSITIKKLIPHILKSIFIFNEIKLQLLIYICEMHYSFASYTFYWLYLKKSANQGKTNAMLRKIIPIFMESLKLCIKYYILFVDIPHMHYPCAENRLKELLEIETALYQCISFEEYVDTFTFGYYVQQYQKPNKFERWLAYCMRIYAMECCAWAPIKARWFKKQRSHVHNFCVRISRFRSVLHCGNKDKRHEIDSFCILAPKYHKVNRNLWFCNQKCLSCYNTTNNLNLTFQ